METYITNLLFAGLLALLSFGLKMANAWLKENTVFKISQGLKEEIYDGVRWAKRKAREELGEQVDQIEFDNKVIQKAFEYVMSIAPGWLEDLGITQEALTSMIEAALEDYL